MPSRAIAIAIAALGLSLGCAPEVLDCPAGQSFACTCWDGTVGSATCTVEGTSTPCKCVDCVPQCEGNECGDNGCGVKCGNCPQATPHCHDDLCSADACVASCAGKECGGDGCGGWCGTCPMGEQCAGGNCAPHEVPPECTPNCAGKACGDDGCGGNCGVCDGDEDACDVSTGQCEALCSADCGDKMCGADGCGGSCGQCPSGEMCLAGVCTGPPCGPVLTCQLECADAACNAQCQQNVTPSTGALLTDLWACIQGPGCSAQETCEGMTACLHGACVAHTMACWHDGVVPLDVVGPDETCGELSACLTHLCAETAEQGTQDWLACQAGCFQAVGGYESQAVQDYGAAFACMHEPCCEENSASLLEWDQGCVDALMPTCIDTHCN